MLPYAYTFHFTYCVSHNFSLNVTSLFVTEHCRLRELTFEKCRSSQRTRCVSMAHMAARRIDSIGLSVTNLPGPLVCKRGHPSPRALQFSSSSILVPRWHSWTLTESLNSPQRARPTWAPELFRLAGADCGRAGNHPRNSDSKRNRYEMMNCKPSLLYCQANIAEAW